MVALGVGLAVCRPDAVGHGLSGDALRVARSERRGCPARRLRRTPRARRPRPRAGSGASRRRAARSQFAARGCDSDDGRESPPESCRGRKTVASGEPLLYWTNRPRGHAQPHRIAPRVVPGATPTKPSVSRRNGCSAVTPTARVAPGWILPSWKGESPPSAASFRIRRSANTSRIHAT